MVFRHFSVFTDILQIMNLTSWVVDD